MFQTFVCSTFWNVLENREADAQAEYRKTVKVYSFDAFSKSTPTPTDLHQALLLGNLHIVPSIFTIS